MQNLGQLNPLYGRTGIRYPNIRISESRMHGLAQSYDHFRVGYVTFHASAAKPTTWFWSKSRVYEAKSVHALAARARGCRVATVKSSSRQVDQDLQYGHRSTGWPIAWSVVPEANTERHVKRKHHSCIDVGHRVCSRDAAIVICNTCRVYSKSYSELKGSPRARHGDNVAQPTFHVLGYRVPYSQSEVIKNTK